MLCAPRVLFWFFLQGICKVTRLYSSDVWHLICIIHSQLEMDALNGLHGVEADMRGGHHRK